ncbi:MAG: SUMF1/EgtB/PvdO family nonheme iron enzyme [Anaerolineales bacterium]|nr:SUMF1/EgtB/PvdO family nonheme iron enzyme [Anaerolineales bacterium]
MKKTYAIVSTLAVLAILVLSACNMGAVAPTEVSTQPPVTEVAGTQPPAVGDETPTEIVVAPIDLAGPPMEVGSKYTYVDGSVLAAVPGGPFIMGYKNYADTPERTVTLSDFWIYSSEVTNSQYALCVNAGKCAPPDAVKNPAFGNYRLVNLPVVGVNYQQAADYCSFVKGRLPTEAEWEKAARGPEGNLFPWGDSGPVCDLLNFNFCKGKTLDIQSYPDGVSYYGLFDMSGNVREWVADWYNPKYYTDGPSTDPLGPEIGDKRSVRSSSFADSGDFTFAAHRFSYKPTESLNDLGFRCVVDDPTQFAPLCTQLAFYGQDVNGQIEDCVPNVKCNDVNIGQGQDCIGVGQPYTIITFSMSNTPPNGWVYDAPGCDPAGGDKFDCRPGDGPVSVTGSCEVTDSGSCMQSCGSHYNLVNGQCVWDGSGTQGTECIAGTTYDPLTQCCSADPGAGVNYDLCPGKYVVNGVCVDDPNGVVDSLVQVVGFNTCSGPGDTPCDPLKDPACQPGSCQPVTCNYPYAPNQDGCSCYCTWGPGKCN